MSMKKKLGVKGDTKPGDLKDAMEKRGFKKAKKAPTKTAFKKMTPSKVSAADKKAGKGVAKSNFQKMLDGKAKKKGK